MEASQRNLISEEDERPWPSSREKSKKKRMTIPTFFMFFLSYLTQKRTKPLKKMVRAKRERLEGSGTALPVKAR